MTLNVASFATAVRTQNPLVHNITNYVAAPLQANALSAVGASPIMADAPEESAQMAALSNVLAVNIGTLHKSSIAAMHLAMQSANEKGIPVIFDPVGVGATAFRQETAQDLLNKHSVSVIRANASEIAVLAQAGQGGKGIDAGEVKADLPALARAVAEKYSCVVAMTGATDYITNGKITYLCRNGHPLMAALVGTGCTASSVVAAFVGAHPNTPLEAACAALSYYGLCGQVAAAVSKGPGSLNAAFLDALYTLSAKEIERNSLITTL